MIKQDIHDDFISYWLWKENKLWRFWPSTQSTKWGNKSFGVLLEYPTTTGFQWEQFFLSTIKFDQSRDLHNLYSALLNLDWSELGMTIIQFANKTDQVFKGVNPAKSKFS